MFCCAWLHTGYTLAKTEWKMIRAKTFAMEGQITALNHAQSHTFTKMPIKIAKNQIKFLHTKNNERKR
jgi:hypothetical protein